MQPDPPGGSAQMFGLVLRQLRGQAGLSLRELGKRALYDYTRLSRAENGETLIPAEKVRLLDEVLQAGGLLIALREAAGTAVPVLAPGPGSVEASESVTLEVRLPDGGIVHVAMSRRQFSQLLATAALSPVLPVVAGPGETSRLTRVIEQPALLDGEVIGYFRRILAEHYAADKMLGPRRLIRPVLAQIEVIDGLRRGARPPYAQPLLRVLAQYGEMAGWLQQDIGNFSAAANWTRQAAEWAHCAGDTQLAAYMLVRQSNIACLTDDYGGVVQLAAAARRLPGPIEPRLTALASQQEARGHALLGDFRTCFTLLDKAADILGGHPAPAEPSAPVYLHHYDLGVLQEQAAACYRAAGQADTAISILEDKISAMPVSLTRDRGHLTAKLAVVVAQSRQPDPSRAAELGMTAIDAARHTGSARILRELRTLSDELSARWPDRRESRAFRDALAAATPAP
ncbi:MAG TPA: helix-turn-helix transcriptional regulator [Streptosporangiaceae bacterium]|nr:helix-turn-helix transcriptional regulator [Streptosporangiaceae bacterium]